MDSDDDDDDDGAPPRGGGAVARRRGGGGDFPFLGRRGGGRRALPPPDDDAGDIGLPPPDDDDDDRRPPRRGGGGDFPFLGRRGGGGGRPPPRGDDDDRRPPGGGAVARPRNAGEYRRMLAARIAARRARRPPVYVDSDGVDTIDLTSSAPRRETLTDDDDPDSVDEIVVGSDDDIDPADRESIAILPSDAPAPARRRRRRAPPVRPGVRRRFGPDGAPIEDDGIDSIHTSEPGSIRPRLDLVVGPDGAPMPPHMPSTPSAASPRRRGLSRGTYMAGRFFDRERQFLSDSVSEPFDDASHSQSTGVESPIRRRVETSALSSPSVHTTTTSTTEGYF